MGSTFGVFLLMNNYFHDVATALLAASGIVLKVMLVRYRSALANSANSANSGNTKDTEDAREYFARVYKGMRAIARGSLLWILFGGIPRTLFYRNFEWANAVEHGQATALIVKHALAFFLVAIGAWLWKQSNNDLNKLQQTRNGNSCAE